MDKELREKLEEIKVEYDRLTEQLSDPGLGKKHQEYKKVAKRQGQLSKLAEGYGDYLAAVKELASARRLQQEDKELASLAAEEIERLEKRSAELEGELAQRLSGGDEEESVANAIIEIRAGTGGEEAALFAADLYRMYSRYAEGKGWKVDVMDSHLTEMGGYKGIIFGVEGAGAFSALRYENGVHRVQRVPKTESSGRIHTSAVSVVVLAEAEEDEIEVKQEDLRIDTFCSSGPGGQSVNTAYSAVRITHEPSGIIVQCQDERSQMKNKAKAMRVLRSRLKEKVAEERRKEEDGQRRSVVGSGDRSEKIRTYNFPQNRVTDHRVSLTLHQLDRVLQGDLAKLLEGMSKLK